MSTKVGIGSSGKSSSYEAGREAAQEAYAQLNKNNQPADLIIVFASYSFNYEELLQGIFSVTKGVPLIGCSSTYEITSAGIQSNTVVVIAIKSTKFKIITGVGKDIDKGTYESGKQLAESIINKIKIKREEIKGDLIILPEGLVGVVTGDGTEMLKGLYNTLGAQVNIIGGAASYNLKSPITFQFIDNNILNNAVCGALLLSSSPTIGVGIRHGFTPKGNPMIITKAKGNIVYELDGKVAAEVYLDYFGLKNKIRFDQMSFIEEVHTYPLGSPQLHGEYLIRHFIKANEDGSIVSSASLPTNAVVRIMSATNDSLLNAVREAAKEAKSSIAEKPKGIIVFSCVSRALMLEETANENDEVKIIKEVFGEDIPIGGFYTYGEIGPVGGGVPLFHNKTIVISAII